MHKRLRRHLTRLVDDLDTLVSMLALIVGPYLVVSAVTGRHASQSSEWFIGTCAISASAARFRMIPRAIGAGWRAFVEEWTSLAEPRIPYLPSGYRVRERDERGRPVR